MKQVYIIQKIYTKTCYAGGVHDYPFILEVYNNKEKAIERVAHLESIGGSYRLVIKDLLD